MRRGGENEAPWEPALTSSRGAAVRVEFGARKLGKGRIVWTKRRMLAGIGIASCIHQSSGTATGAPC